LASNRRRLEASGDAGIIIPGFHMPMGADRRSARNLDCLIAENPLVRAVRLVTRSDRASANDDVALIERLNSA